MSRRHIVLVCVSLRARQAENLTFLKAPHMSSSLAYAVRALRRELFEFRLTYPLEIVPGAGPKESLLYYLYSDKLSWSVMSMDAAGIPRARGRLYGEVYKPSYIAWWGLVNLGHYLLRDDPNGRDVFLRQVDWLEEHVTFESDGSAVWTVPFDNVEGKHLCLAPWTSAYDQGIVISALVRGYRLTKRRTLIDLLERSYRAFEIKVEAGGVRQPLRNGRVVYAEVPGSAAPGILDGFLTSLLGLYDLMVETGNPKVSQLFDDGITGLRSQLSIWDYRGKWSWYASRAYLCPPSYHVLNWRLLTVIARLTQDSALAAQAARWNPERLSRRDKIEIYLAHLVTKNARRIRHRTWQHTQPRVRLLAQEARRRRVNTVGIACQAATEEPAAPSFASSLSAD